MFFSRFITRNYRAIDGLYEQDTELVESYIYESIILEQFLGPRDHKRMGSLELGSV
jgi:hypothetical protein